MDTVSHLLRMARLEASLDKRCLLTGTTRMEVARHRERQAPFHVLLDGHCRLQVGAAVLDLSAGDVVIIPSGTSHRVTTAGRGRLSTTTETEGDAFATTRSARDGEPVIDLFCGHYTFGAGAGQLLLRSLPDPVHVSFGSTVEGAEVLRTLSNLMRGEAAREGVGTAAVFAALCTVLLVMVLRTERGVATDSAPWTAVSDERIAAVIGDLLAGPGEDWPIERLAGRAAMSRATFLRHFRRETGMAVGAFLAQVRLMTAADRLTSTDDTVATISAQVGYRSESAFSRTFREATGLTPARFRRAEKPG